MTIPNIWENNKCSTNQIVIVVKQFLCWQTHPAVHHSGRTENSFALLEVNMATTTAGRADWTLETTETTFEYAKFRCGTDQTFCKFQLHTALQVPYDMTCPRHHVRKANSQTSFWYAGSACRESLHCGIDFGRGITNTGPLSWNKHGLVETSM